MNIREKIERIEALEVECYERFKALKAFKAEVQREQEFPQVGDDYWFINSTGNVINEKWGGLRFEKDRLEFGNVFQTEQQAEFAVEKLKVEAELRKFSRPFKEDANNFFIVFNTKVVSLNIWYREHNKSQGAIYFESAEKAQQAIDTIGAERIKKYIFGVED